MDKGTGQRKSPKHNFLSGHGSLKIRSPTRVVAQNRGPKASHFATSLRRLAVLEGFLWIDSVNDNNEASNSFTEVLVTIKFLGMCPVEVSQAQGKAMTRAVIQGELKWSPSSLFQLVAFV